MADRSVVEILVALEEEAGQQLAFARRLDVHGLNASTQRRQDLLFELQVAGQDNPEAARAPEALAGIARLQAVDHRLARICQSVLALLSEGGREGGTDKYGANGRLNG